MQDHGEHNLNDHEDPLAGPTWIVGLLGVVLLVVIVLGVTALTKSIERNTLDDVYVERDIDQLNAVKARDHERLHGDARREEYVDLNNDRKWRLVIPIEDAKDIAAKELAAAQQSN